MKQIFLHLKTGQIELAEIPTPALMAGGVLVKNSFSLISAGTERSVIELGQKNLIEKAQARPDLVHQVINKIKTDGLVPTLKAVRQKMDDYLPLGYSSAGEVMAVGEAVKEFRIGDRVACAGGNYASHAEIVFIPKNLCAKIPDNVSWPEAAFATVAAIALEGIRNLNLTHGEKVGVIGLGLIGQLTVQFLKAYGHPVIGFDINEQQIKKAKEMGLDRGVIIGRDDSLEIAKSFTENAGLDAVVVTAATKSDEPIILAGELARKRGKISIVGDVPINIPRKIYYEKELQTIISCSYGPGRYDKNYEEKGIDYPFAYARWTEKRNLEEALRLMADKKINIKPLITHVFEFDKSLEAYNLILNNSKKEEIIGVLLKYPPETKIEPKIIYKEISKKYQSKNHLNIGLIGIGNFAKSIILPSLKKITNITLLAAADNNGKKAEDVIKKCGGKYATTDYHQIINDPEIDLVIVATRHGSHAKIVIEALENNKNVHVEKPLCLSEDELKKIIEIEQKSKGRLMVGFNRRFAPLTLKTKEIFKNISPLLVLCRVNAGFISGESWVHDSTEGGGRIIGEACHFIDLCQFLINSEPTRVFATSIPLGGTIQTEDNFSITLDFKNGSRATIIYTSLGPKLLPKEYIEVFGGNKTVVINNFKNGIIYEQNKQKKIRGFGQDKGHAHEFKVFVETIQQGKPSPIPFKEIVLSTQATFDAIKAAKEKKVIDI